MSTAALIALFHHRWAPPALAELARRDGVRFVELQNRLGVGRESLRRALDALLELGFARRNPGYGHPLRPEYVVTEPGRGTGAACARVLAAGDPDLLLRKWSVPTPCALALALSELELGGLVEREVVASRPPFAVYRTTAAGRRIREAL